MHFTVDAALLRELGERLVGRPYIALAELVKNSYDADATTVLLRFTPDSIEVSDNGNGMDLPSFKDFWMRIGSPHKEALGASPIFRRPLTGSKGIGRLAVQLLANEISINTVDRENTTVELHAHVDWAEAVASESLTNAVAEWQQYTRRSTFSDDCHHGTTLALKDLQHHWTAEAFQRLAQELWTLEPPFGVEPSEGGFHIVLEHSSQYAVKVFQDQMRAVLDLWSARIVGKLLPPTENSRTRIARIVVQFGDGGQQRTDLKIEDCLIDQLEYEVRVFSLRYRQPYGISVSEARRYLRAYGGVGVYDAGFRLPYYGADSDWLDIARDAGRRLSRSELLPEELQVTEGLQYIPTNERLYGVVQINTNAERRTAAAQGHPREALSIQMTRDRLVDNDAYKTLVRLVRFGIDFFANQEAGRAYERTERNRKVAPLREQAKNVSEVLDRHADEIPAALGEELKAELESIVRASKQEADDLASQASLLGALATAGISSLAYEHEAAKQLLILEDVSARLRDGRLTAQERRRTADDIELWVQSARATRALFGHLLTAEGREKRVRYRARRIIRQVAEQVSILSPGLTIESEAVPDGVRLPLGTMAEWVAIFQNLLVNASNATLDSPAPLVEFSYVGVSETKRLLVSDNGVGVDLKDAEQLFRPFVRRQRVSDERRELGLGGTGLGLTIVRMLARQLEVAVHFVPALNGYATTVELSWNEE